MGGRDRQNYIDEAFSVENIYQIGVIDSAYRGMAAKPFRGVLREVRSKQLRVTRPVVGAAAVSPCR
jgi:hypothetical protein